MIAVDTNILVRVVTKDEPEQTARAAKIIDQADVFVPKTVLLEAEWVLRYTYELDRTAILKAFRGVLGLPTVTVEDSVSVALALEWYEAGLDFADALHLATSREADRFVTFDDKLRRGSKKIDAISVVLA